MTVDVPIPEPALSDSQADFDFWLSGQTITHSYDEKVTKCVAQISLSAPFNDKKSSLTITHNCEANLNFILVFSSFSGEFLVSNGFDSACYETSGGIVCNLDISAGNSEMFGLLTSEFDFQGIWYEAKFVDLTDGSIIFTA